MKKTPTSCKENQEWNSETKRCRKKCNDNQERNEKGRCIKKRSPKKSKSPSKRLATKPSTPKSESKTLFRNILKCEKGDKRCSLADILDDKGDAALYIMYDSEDKQCIYYKKGDQMGQPSAFGSVYYTCCDEKNKNPKKCKHITKIIKIMNQKDRDNFVSETFTHQYIAKAGLAPRIVKSYITEKHGIIIMEKMKETLGELMARTEFKKMSENKVRNIARGWATEIGRLIVNINKMGLFHNDAHANNFMTDNKGKFYMIDFGRTKKIHYKQITIGGEHLVSLCNEHDLTTKNYSTEKCIGMLEYEYRQIDWFLENRNRLNSSHPSYWMYDAYANRLLEIKNMEIKAIKEGTLSSLVV